MTHVLVEAEKNTKTVVAKMLKKLTPYVRFLNILKKTNEKNQIFRLKLNAKIYIAFENKSLVILKKSILANEHAFLLL